MTRTVAIASAVYLAGYSVVSLVTGQSNVWVGDLAQLVPPLAFAGLSIALARRSTGQVRLFWNLNAAHAVVWAVGQSVWTYYDVNAGRVPVISPTDPIFFLSSLPLAAALYGRPEQEKPRWLFDIIVLDIVLIGLFAAFAYVYFVVSLVVTGGSEDVYHTNLTQLLNARNFILAAWAAWLWRTARTEPWRRMLAIYCGGLTLTFVGGILSDVLDAAGNHGSGSLWDLAWMMPYAVLSLAAARAYDERLFAPAEHAPPLSRLPVVSLIAVALLILIPTTDEIARRVLDVSPLTESLRTRLALTMMIPFGVVVVVREFLSRRALLRAGQQLVSTREELAQKEKLAAVGQLVSGVAHELNNPLQGVLGYAELLALSQKDQPESEELRAIRDNANRAAGIVRNLLTFAGRATPARSWQQINGVVREAAQRRVPFLQLAGTRLDFRLAERLPLVYLDAARFQQVLINLIENAEAAIDTSGAILIATRREPDPDRIVIEISDNGSGVRVEDLSKIFDPFFTTRGVGEGTGLGLSVCYGIVREHGGLIRGENRDVGGAIFTIELPVTADSQEQRDVFDQALPAGTARNENPADSLLEPVAANRKARILVVDDEDSNATLVRRALDQAGYDVESTTLSRRALVMIERTAYDVVIADVRMPELNGQELYSRVCQIRPEMSRRFIFITGDIDSEDTLDFLDRSRCGYFMKPFNLERLTSAVTTLVGGPGDDRIG
ncbi:MAG TPA: ATP-binding protein [Vicinamibacterales bacterium]|nr:ATP-binding protein [Vicinamibacterales bacterium]